MKKIIISAITSCLSMMCVAQNTQSVIGKINDGGDQKVIMAATVSLLRSADSVLVKTAVADKDGNFSFETVKEGSYIISASSIGHLKAYSNRFTVNTGAPAVQVGTLQLNPVEKSMEGVTVTAKKPFIERRADRTIINVEASVTNAGNTAMEVLEKSPGVSVDKDGKISLKGKQGVIVMIDGKQTYMGAQELATYLQGLPASNLDQIELMPNPSSKYDAAGNSGIINIKLKKNRQKGFNGSINSTIGQGIYTRTFNTLNLNYRNGKFNVFSTLGANFRKTSQQLDIHREYKNTAGNTNAIFDQQVNFLKYRNNDNARIGMDYYASKKTTLGFVLSGYVTPNRQEGENISYLKDGAGNVNSILQSASHDKENWKNGSANFNLRHVFDSTGTELTADVDVLGYKSIHDQKFYSQNFTPDWVKQFAEDLLSDIPAKINVYSAKVDFSKSIKSGIKMETGVKSSFVKTDNAAGYFNVVNGISTVDNDKTNHFKYSENINAAYLNLNKTFKKWSLQTGLRMENTNYDGNQFGNPIKPDSSFSRSYTGLFPTVFAGYTMNEKNEFSISYGRRISRPDYESLNPFIFFIDKYTYEAGNPFLKPMYANVFELSHTYKKNFNTTLNYSHNKDMFNEYFEQSGYATIVRENNYGSIDELSLSVNATIKPAKWWTMIPYAEVNYNKVKSNQYGFALNTEGTGFSSNLNNQFKFKKGWGGEVSGMYRSAMNRGQFNIEGMKVVNAGISKQIIKSKGSLKFNVSDIFRTAVQHGVIDIQNTKASFTQRSDSRNLTLTFNYRFGKPFKTQQRKTGGAKDEQNRIKGAN